MQLSKKEFQEKLESRHYTLLDVRTAHEQLIYGVISQNQLHIDVYTADALERLQKLPKEGKYLVYCFHGNRSQHVVQVMEEFGVTEVYDLEGGIAGWNHS